MRLRSGFHVIACGVTALLLASACTQRDGALFVADLADASVTDSGVSRGVAWGDFDGDGDPDLVVTRPTWGGRVQENRLYRNDAGALRPVDAELGGPGAWEGAVWIDPDNDGDLDLHVVGRDGSGSRLFENRDGRLHPRTPDPLQNLVRSASMACWADVDGDGLLDVFLVGYRSGRNVLLRNRGAWQFEAHALPAEPVDVGAGRACAWGDLDGDRLPELVVVNARRPHVLYRNRGQMRLVTDTTAPIRADSSYGYGLSMPDANGDGLRDVFVAHFDAGNALFLGNVDGSLRRAPGHGLESPASKGHVWADFDLNGYLDLYLGSGTPAPGMVNRLYRATDGGAFSLDTSGAIGIDADTSAAIAAADIDGDGDLDLYVANWGSPGSRNRLYRNAARGGWLKVRLEGRCASRMPIGSKVSVRISNGSGARWLHRWLDASTGYAGQNEPVLHFGLGTSRPDSVVIEWPSGTTTRLGDVPISSVLSIREDENC